MADKSRIKIKLGNIEVECEGSEEFLKTDFIEMFKVVTNTYNSIDIVGNPPSAPSSNDDLESNNVPQLGTTNSIAAKLGVKTGTDLIIAGASHLHFVKNQNTFSRKDLLDEIKLATSYYKNSYGSNLTKYLTSLVKDGVLLETSKDNYALSATKIEELKASFA